MRCKFLLGQIHYAPFLFDISKFEVTASLGSLPTLYIIHYMHLNAVLSETVDSTSLTIRLVIVIVTIF